MNGGHSGNRTIGSVLTLMAAMILSTCCADDSTIELEGDYPGHLQDIWMSSNTIWWAHTQYLVKTDRSGRIVRKAEVGGHHAGCEVKDGRLYSAVCAFNGEPRGKTTPDCHVMIGEYDAETLARIDMHVLDINDRAGSFCFLEDGTFLVGCLRHPSLKPTEVKFHHIGKDYRLIKTHVVDLGKPVKLGIEVIRRFGEDIYLFIYGGPVMELDAKTFAVTGRYKSEGGQLGFAREGDLVWTGQSQKDKTSGRYRSKLVRKPLDRPWVTTSEIFAGGTLEIELGPDPEPWKMFDRRLGMFIHWGIYSVGGWHEQERMRKAMPREEYEKYVSGFTAEKFDADRFVDAAESAGADYIVFTSKHHDGFCLWDTKATDFNVMNSPARRDVLKELADACRRRGMKLGLYYSNPDWHHPNAYNPKSSHQLAKPNPGDEPDMAKYVEYVKAQITELMTGYGEICCLFWDIPSKVDVPELNELVRRLQPNIRIDDRGWGSKGDYSTPERGVPEGAQFPRPTEACDSVGTQSWGYRRNEDYRTVGYLTRAIDRTLSMGGNFLLNVGPKPDGTIPDEALDRLRRVGAWYGKVRESYRGVETVTNLVRGAMVTRRGNVVYLHYPKGVDATGLDLAPLARLPCAAKVLNDGVEPECEIECLPTSFRTGLKPSLHLKGVRADELANESVVIRLEL